ncbi:MAG TPA: GNAT family N-acetyltransferase [Caulobacteraceae bacterium]
MSLALRRLTADDAAVLRELRLEAFAVHPRDFRSSPADEAAAPLAALAGKLGRDHVLGLFDGETLVGAAGLSIDPRAKLAHKGLIWGVYVRPAWRGQGGAERLLAGLIEAAKGRVESLHLVVSDGNGPALRLYTRLGFSQWALEPRALRLDDGTWVDEIWMERSPVHPPHK